MKQRYNALSPAADDKLGKIELALNDRKNFEAGKAKVEKWITETDEQIQGEPDLGCPLPETKGNLRLLPRFVLFNTGFLWKSAQTREVASLIHWCSSLNNVFMTISNEYLSIRIFYFTV